MANTTEDKYIVAALAASLPDKYEDCVVVRQGDELITTHTKAYGPDSREACEKWRDENCGKENFLRYIVAALSAGLPRYEQCITVKDGDFFPATHTKVFGPASKDECQKWRKENCVSEAKPDQPAGNQPAGDRNGDAGRADEREMERDPRWFYVSVIQYVLIALVTVVFIGVIAFGLWNIAALADRDTARGLITFLVAVSTIFIATLAVLTAMVLRDYKERFALAKEVLALMIGVLGTIIGFYFGQAVSENNAGQSSTPTPRPTVSATPVPGNTPANTQTNTTTNTNPTNTSNQN